MQRLFVAAAHRLGGASALATHLDVSESDLRRFLTGEAFPPEYMLLRAVDVVVDDFHAMRKEFSPEAWRSLWGGRRMMLQPKSPLQERLAQRIAQGTGRAPAPVPRAQWREPAWEDVAPGIACKLFAKDEERDLVSMLVRLAPGGEYPPHTHAGVEELHLLEGELWIDERKLHPGDYSRAEPGTGDRRVCSQTGCTCVLITSSADILG